MGFDDILDEAFEDDNRDENEDNLTLNQDGLNCDNFKMLNKVVNVRKSNFQQIIRKCNKRPC